MSSGTSGRPSTYPSGGAVTTRRPSVAESNPASKGDPAAKAAAPRSGACRSALCEALEYRRLFTAGDLDTSFSGDGKATVAVAGSSSLQATNVAVQSNGKVIVAGDCFSGALRGKMVLARFNANGTLDTTFGGAGTGVASTNFAEFNLSTVTTRGLAVQPADDKIVVVGWAFFGGVVSDFVIARFTADGQIDPTFSDDGKDSIINFDELSLGTYGHEVAIQADGKIVVAGSSVRNSNEQLTEMFVARYHTNGTLDNSFAGNGTRVVEWGENCGATVLALDQAGTPATNPNYGDIILAGAVYPSSDFHSQRIGIARLNSTGGLDTSFSGDGLLVMPFASGYTYSSPSDVVVQAGSKMVVLSEVGSSDLDTRRFGLLRFNSNGAMDTTFGESDSRTEIDFGDGRDLPNSLLIGQAGKLLAGGVNGGDMAVACLSADGELDVGGFGGDGKISIDFGSSSAQAFGMALAPGGTVVAAGSEAFATARFFDRKAVMVSIGSLQPVASEAGQSVAGLLVARLERLSTPTRVYLSVGGTATAPVFAIPSQWDYSVTNVAWVGFNVPRTYVDIPANQTFVGVTLTPFDDARVEGDETAVFSIAPDSTYDIGTPPKTTLVIRDNDIQSGPAVTTSSFVYDTALPQHVTMTFNQNVATSISAGDFTVTGPSGAVPFSLSHDGVTNTSKLSFTGSVLPDGNYTARASAAGITNSSGTPMSADFDFQFFFLTGDANRDRAVDISDLAILATNWQQTGKVFSDGDFNYDGTVDISDLAILATNWQSSLPAAGLTGRASRLARQARVASAVLS